MQAKEWIDLEYMTACGGNRHIKIPYKACTIRPIAPNNPGSIMRLHKGHAMFRLKLLQILNRIRILNTFRKY